jgi:hypothetical protein
MGGGTRRTPTGVHHRLTPACITVLALSSVLPLALVPASPSGGAERRRRNPETFVEPDSVGVEEG